MGKTTDQLWKATEQYRAGYQPDVSAGLARFQQRMAADQATPVRTLTPRRSRQWSVAAAIALIAVVAAALVWRLGAGATGMQLAQAAQAKEVVLLADGTQVILNKGAELQYPADLDEQATRTVALSGEAYFEVAPDAAHPFIIETSETTVEVLGTAFNLRAVPGESFTEVEVKEGKVAFRDKAAGESIILTANEYGRYTHQEGFAKEDAPNLNRLAWHTDQLVFSDTPLRKVIPMLERYYGIEIQGGDKLAATTYPISASWTKQDLQTIPAVIESLTPLELVEVEKGVYELRGDDF